jgi:hypothetical protein
LRSRHFASGCAARFSTSTFLGAATLLAGTASGSTILAEIMVALVGTWLWARAAWEETTIFAAAVAGGLAVVLITRPNAAGYAGVLVRYLLPIFPFVSSAMGVAFQTLVRRVATARGRYLLWGTAAFMGAALYAGGPLPRIHAAVNSFTKHPALQFDLAEHDPDRVRPAPLEDDATGGIHRSQLQPFYAQLASASGTAPIIEYPFILGGRFDVLYFTQAVHHRPVLAGYYRSGMQDSDRFGLALGPRVPALEARLSPGYNMTLDHILGRDRPDARVRFHTLVDILDETAVGRSGAEYLVLHGNLLRESFGWGQSTRAGSSSARF